MLITKFLQITTPIVSEAATTEDSITLIDLILKGGFIMIPIFILSILTVYIFVERYLTIKNATKNTDLLVASVNNAVKAGNLNDAKTAAHANKSAISNILLKGIAKIGQPIKNIEASMEAAGKIEVMKLEKNLGILGIIAAIAPMLGFVGTISGVIKIFYNISLADNISIGLIAGGLYEKMVTSAAGLIVGMLAHTAYHYLNILLESVVFKMESASLEFIDTVSE